MGVLIKTLIFAVCFSLLIGNINSQLICERVVEEGYTWPDTNAGSVAELNCNASGSSNLQGVIKRACTINGEWQSLDLMNCTNPMFNGIQDDLNNLEGENPAMISTSTGINLAERLVEATRPPPGTQGAFISPSNLRSAVDGLQLLQVSIKRKVRTSKMEALEGFGSQWFGTCSNVIDPRNAASYMSSDTDALDLTNKLVDSLDGITADYGEFSTGERMIEHPNLQVVGGPVQAPASGEVVTFPTTMSMSGGETVKFDSGNFETLRSQTGTGNGNAVHIGMSISNGLSDIIKLSLNNTKQNKTPISKFVTVGAGGQQGRVEFSTPIMITFNLSEEDSQYVDQTMYERACGYWNTSLGIWSRDGLQILSTQETNKFVCSSSHMTSFSVLVKTDPFNENLSYAEELALSIVTYILCIVSMISLASAIVVFLLLGKELFRKDLYMVHLNYAISLTISLALFVFGVQSARNDYVACGIIAGVLHYAFLSVFTWSFCEAILVMYMLFALFATRKIYPYLLLVGWGLPIPVVIITLGVRWYNYGVAGQYCWLSTENGVIWSFIGPALSLVFINLILLIISIVRILTGLKVKMRQMTRVKQAKAAMIATFILVPLLGIPWIVAVLNFFVSVSLFQWIFVILNTPQGLMFFLLYVVNNRELTKKIFWRKKEMRSSRNTQIQRASEYSPKRSTVAQFRKPSSQSLDLNSVAKAVVNEGESSLNELTKGMEKEGFVGVNNPSFSPEHVGEKH